MQQRMEFFGGKLPEWLQHRHDYGLNLYDLGRVMQTAENGKWFLGQVYQGIRSLDREVQVPHEMLLAMNPAEILALYAGAGLTRRDNMLWQAAMGRKNFWEVVSAVHRPAFASTPGRRSAIALLRHLDSANASSYATLKGSLQQRLKELPQSVALQFMAAFGYSLQDTGAKDSSSPAGKHSRGLDEAVFSYFSGKFAEGERLLSLAQR